MIEHYSSDHLKEGQATTLDRYYPCFVLEAKKWKINRLTRGNDASAGSDGVLKMTQRLLGDHVLEAIDCTMARKSFRRANWAQAFYPGHKLKTTILLLPNIYRCPPALDTSGLLLTKE